MRRRRKFSIEKCFGEFEFAKQGGRRDAEHLGRVLGRKAAEKHQFDDLTLAGIEFGQLLQRHIERKQVEREFRTHCDRFVERDPIRARAAFLPSLRASVVHQDVAHDARRNRIKMETILPPRFGGDHLDIGFVNESRRTQGVPATFRSHEVIGEASQLIVDERQKSLLRVAIAGSRKL